MYPDQLLTKLDLVPQLMGMGSIKVGAAGSGTKLGKKPMQQGSSSRQELGQYTGKTNLVLQTITGVFFLQQFPEEVR